MTTIVAFIVVLGITITLHEFGHFAMAKLLKIRVLVFSLGFGPKLASFTRGRTEYRLSPFPIGGYVKMAGETFDEERKGAPDEFLSHPRWHRFLIAVSGPFMNILLAVAILTFFYLQGMYVPRYPKEPAVIGPIVPNSIAKRAGLESGDRVVSVNGNPVRAWEDMEIALGTAPRNALNIEVERFGRILPLRFDDPKVNQTDPASLGFKFSLSRTIVEAIDANSPAKKAGLQEGDEILSVQGNGKIAKDYSQILNTISESKGIPLDFEVRRPTSKQERYESSEAAASQTWKLLHLSIVPVEDNGRVIVGFYPNVPADLQKYGLWGAIKQSVYRNYDTSSWTFKIIGRILRGSASIRTLSGPIEIAHISGSVASSRSARLFFGFIGLVSLQLGVFNLLPIPILDGGVIALLIIEGLMRRDLSLNLKEKIVQVGLVFLILLMGFVVFNDLSKIDYFNRLFR